MDLYFGTIRPEYSLANQWLNGIIDEVRISNISRTPTKSFGNLTSKPISIPPGMLWDTIFINKTQMNDSFLNVTILNALNNQSL